MAKHNKKRTSSRSASQVSRGRLAQLVTAALCAGMGQVAVAEGLLGTAQPAMPRMQLAAADLVDLAAADQVADLGSTAGSPASKSRDAAPEQGSRTTGFVEFSSAFTTPHPAHWSKLRGRLELVNTGSLGEGLKYKISGRLDADAAYFNGRSYYTSDVRKDQRADLQFRETYLDFSAGGLDWRVGGQHIVWGEMVGLFLADVVSPRDMREFLLPEFEQMRLPQWAVRAEHFGEDWHSEFIWIPVPTVDRIGKPGADFYPVRPPAGTIITADERPSAGGNVGLRLTREIGGWDLSGFAYSSRDNQASFERRSLAPLSFAPIHARIKQVGGTLSTDVGFGVLRAEAVYTRGRQFSVTRLSEADGLIPLKTMDWAVGLDHTTEHDTRLNVQLYQRAFLDYDQETGFNRYESGLTFLVNTKLGDGWEAEALAVHGLNRAEWMFRPKLILNQGNVRWQFGLDAFGGPSSSFFGRFDRSDRVYGEMRYAF